MVNINRIEQRCPYGYSKFFKYLDRYNKTLQKMDLGVEEMFITTQPVLGSAYYLSLRDSEFIYVHARSTNGLFHQRIGLSGDILSNKDFEEEILHCMLEKMIITIQSNQKNLGKKMYKFKTNRPTRHATMEEMFNYKD